ncbi:MAG: lytic transglycosylase domain-containing protein, partial [Alphaproteobacteria bacterium]|nr:lytic transglycosylase domain-containing protein [Alphaproteobacteria bacterium]
MNRRAFLPIHAAARGLVGLILIGSFFLAIPPSSVLAADQAPLSAADSRLAREAFQAAQSGHWAKAELTARDAKDPMLLKLIQWLGLVREGVPVPFYGVAKFFEQNLHWPLQTQLRRRVEESIGPDVPSDIVLDWFQRHPPGSAVGKIRYAEALMETGAIERGKAILREAWVSGALAKAQQNAVLKRHGKILTKDDHASRLDHLLWEGKTAEAQAMLWRVDAPVRLLAEARMTLRARRGNVDRLISRVPPEMQKDKGLLYERARWRRAKGKYAEAREAFNHLPADLVRPDLWWKERAVLARRGLREGHITDAYGLVKTHGLSPAQSAPFAEAEWMAGWIAHRFLGDHAAAANHFKAMFDAVVYPVSKARGAYWAGRAAEAGGKTDEAKTWYTQSAANPTVFYGQLAAARLGASTRLKLPVEPEPTAAEKAEFERHELTRATRTLAAFGYKDELRPFILQLADLKESPGWRRLAAALAREYKREDAAVMVAKRASRSGIELAESGYPMLRLPAASSDGRGVSAPEAPLVLAVVRQESAFQNDAVSHAGAKGLMQLMPQTASEVARTLRISHNPARLSEPEYNLRLGQAYLRDLLVDFQGSYVLSLAAYNAGPKRAREWMKANGDPRGTIEDMIDWIEM